MPLQPASLEVQQRHTRCSLAERTSLDGSLGQHGLCHLQHRVSELLVRLSNLGSRSKLSSRSIAKASVLQIRLRQALEVQGPTLRKPAMLAPPCSVVSYSLAASLLAL